MPAIDRSLSACIAGTYTVNVGARRVLQFRKTLSIVLMIDDIEINPVQAGPQITPPYYQILGTGDDPLDVRGGGGALHNVIHTHNHSEAI